MTGEQGDLCAGTGSTGEYGANTAVLSDTSKMPAADFEGIGQGGEQSEGIEFWFTEY